MRSERRGLQRVRTTRTLLDNRRVRTPGAALLELSSLANERSLLERELDRWRRRHAEIEERLAAIQAKEERLRVVAKVASPEGTDPPSPMAGRLSTPMHLPSRGIRTTEFQY